MEKLGSKKKPLVLNVHTEDEKKRMSSLSNKNGFYHIITLDRSSPRNIDPLLKALGMWKEKTPQEKTGRNDPSPIG